MPNRGCYYMLHIASSQETVPKSFSEVELKAPPKLEVVKPQKPKEQKQKAADVGKLILVDQHRYELLSPVTSMRLYPLFLQANPAINPTGWLIFNQLGFFITTPPKKGESKFKTYSLDYLKTKYFPWVSEECIADHIRVLEVKGFIKVSRHQGCWSSFELTTGGKALYKKIVINSEERYIQVYPELVQALGNLNAAIILIRLHNSCYRKEELTRTVENMHKTFFEDIFSIATFQRGIKYLYETGLLTKLPNTSKNGRTTANGYGIEYALLQSKYFPFTGEVIHDNKTLGMVYTPKPY